GPGERWPTDSTAPASRTLAVRPDHQGRGLGQEIIRRLVARAAGPKKIILYANPGTEGFYRRLGFLPMNTAMTICHDPARHRIRAAERGVLTPAVRPAARLWVRPAARLWVRPAARPMVRPAARLWVRPAARPMVRPAATAPESGARCPRQTAGPPRSAG